MSAAGRGCGPRAPSTVAAVASRLRALAARGLDRILRVESALLRFQNPLFILFISGTLAYGAGFAWYGLLRFDKFDMLLYNYDDSFYYFQVAWYLAQGEFSTFDGGITRTNGYHPLWMFLITPFYWILDKEAALFGIKAFEITLMAGAAALVACAARLARLPWALFFATLPILYQHHALFGGMEGAAALFMLTLFFLAVCLHTRDAERWQWLLTAVAFALPWVRFEYAVVSLASTAALWVVADGRAGAPAAHRLRRLFGSSSIPAIGSLAGVLVYFAYNRAVFGGAVPVSGAVKTAWAHAIREVQGGHDITRAVQEALSVPVYGSELAVAVELCVWLLLVLWLVGRSGGRAGRGLLAFLICMFGLVAVHIAEFVSLVVVTHPQLAGAHYWAPSHLMMACIVPARCCIAIYLVRRFVAPRSARLASGLRVGVLLAGAVVLLAKADLAQPFWLVNYTSNPDSASYRSFGELQRMARYLRALYMNTQIADRVLPDGSVIGSWDAGQTGYFSRFPVVNLDGLVNSHDYLRTVRIDGNFSGYPVVNPDALPHSHDYFRATRVDGGSPHAIYRKFGITHFANGYRISYGKPDPIGTMIHTDPLSHDFGSFLSFAEPQKDFDAATWFWERMEPHFDFRAADTGAVVDGRLVWAVARDCAPGELLLWSWGDSPDDAALRQWGETDSGLCADSLLLPHGITSPISFEREEALPIRAAEDRRGEIHSRFNVDVHEDENMLVYRMEDCRREDTETRFFLHVVPADSGDLPEDGGRSGFDNLDFDFAQHGQRVGESCIVVRRLPEYRIAALRTGQQRFEDGEYHRVWEGALDFDAGANASEAAR